MILLRLRFWLLLAAAILLPLYGERAWHALRHGMERAPPLEETLQEQVRQVVGHVLHTEQWTIFPLTLNGSVLRILTNGEVLAPLPAPDGVEWPYALEYRLVDGDGTTAMAGTYHHDTRATLFQLPGEATWRTPAFSRVGHDPLSDTRIFPLNVAGYKRPLALHLRLKGKDPALGRILARVSMQELTDPDRQATLWQRLSPDAREKIAALTLYPADLLSEAEKRNLMHDLWRPQGPRGLPGRDYRSLPFLVWEEGMDNLLEPFVLPQGLPFGGTSVGVIPLPEEVGPVRLSLASATAEAQEDPLPVLIRWFGRLAHERQSWSLAWQGKDLTVTPPAGGLLLASTPRHMVLRAFHLPQQGEEVEITPQPLLSAYWSGQPQTPLRFPVHGNGYDDPVPFRLSLRLMALPEAPPWQAHATVAWRFLDAADNPLAAGSWSWLPRPSPFDRPTGTPHAETEVSLPENRVLSAPAGSRTLEVSALPPFFVAVANRPPDLVHAQRIPEDAFAQISDDDPRQPAWFPLRPAGWRAFPLEGRLLVSVSPTPQEEPDTAPLAAGWQSLEPDHAALGRFLLTARGEGANALPVTGRGSGYLRLPANQPLRVELAAEPGVTRLTPTLAYGRNDATEAAPLTLTVDGETTLRTHLPGASGEITLPPMTPGPHQLTLDSSTKTLFLSHGAEPTHVKRFAQRLRPGEPLRFRVEKRHGDPLILSGRLHTPLPHAEDTRSRLLATVDLPPRTPGQQAAEWTIPRRRFDIRPESGEPALVLGAGGESVDGGQPFFIPLNEDLPPGAYTVTLTLEAGPARYLTLGIATFEPVEERRLFLEESSP